MKINELPENMQKILLELSEKKQSLRPVFNGDLSNFIQKISYFAIIELIKRNVFPEFNIDEHNKSIIEMLFYYATKNNDNFCTLAEKITKKQYSYNISKGLLIAGSIGVGKTLLLTSFCNLYAPKIIFEKYFSMDLLRVLQKTNISDFANKTLFIDDLGKETAMIKDFGTEYKPIVELLNYRYNSGAWTLATSNYTIQDTLPIQYGEAVVDRFKEMFNIIEISGNSKRK